MTPLGAADGSLVTLLDDGDFGGLGLTRTALREEEALVPFIAANSGAGRPGAVAPSAIETEGNPNGLPPDERALFMSTELASRQETRFGLAAVLVSSIIFIGTAPFAKVAVSQVPAFIPIYVSALVACDVMTAVLLFGQFHFLRSRALLILASGYLFTASITSAYTLIFPGLFSPTGLFGAGPQSTSAMYMFWHAGLPLAVIGYVLVKNDSADAIRRNDPARVNTNVAVLFCIAVVVAIVVGFTTFVMLGQEYIPVFIQGNRTTGLGRIVLLGDWILTLLALLMIWWRKPHTVIDLWLMVVMCAWLFDIGLSAILNTGRYDVGWYVGRIYGLLAAGFLLTALMVGSSNYYARLIRMSARLSAANRSLEGDYTALDERADWWHISLHWAGSRSDGSGSVHAANDSPPVR